MILSDSKQLIYNGNPVTLAYYNGAKVWPVNNVVGHRVYISWAPEKLENITLNGMWWNGPMMTEDSIYRETQSTPDAAYKNGNGWQTMSWEEVDKMVSTATQAASFYCKEISFRVDSTAFNTFEFKTDPYYQPTGNVIVEVDALTDDGPIMKAQKLISLAPNTVYTVFDGDHL